MWGPIIVKISTKKIKKNKNWIIDCLKKKENSTKYFNVSTNSRDFFDRRFNQHDVL